MRRFFLQINFILLEGVNILKEFFPYPLRNFFLLLMGMKIHLSSSIHRKCRFFSFGKFSMGRNSVVNSGCYLDNRRGITIGNNTAIAHDTKIYSLGHDINSPKFETKGAPVIIGNNCFIFSNVLIMPGVRIGDGAVILPGAVVTKDIAPFSVVGGNPARFIKNRDTKIDYITEYNYWFAL